MSFQKTKVDADLGHRVQKHLEYLGLATPTTELLNKANEGKIEAIKQHVEACMEILGLDLSDDSLVDTPRRVAKMWVLEKFWGLHPENFPKITTVENKMGYDEILIERDIKVLSDCEHHLVQIDGFAHVAYIPNGKVLGLSKMNRVVEYFSRRPQIQERLTEQICETLKYILDTEHVAVTINARHYCVISRGVEDQNSSTVTSHLSGAFRKDPATRKEFFDLIKL